MTPRWMRDVRGEGLYRKGELVASFHLHHWQMLDRKGFRYIGPADEHTREAVFDEFLYFVECQQLIEFAGNRELLVSNA